MSAYPVILTRIRPPQRRKDILRRPRLLDTLHRNIHRKLTFVSAPAGYGKTALLLDFAADLEAPVCWYGISPEHNDLTAFAQHLVAALQQQFPKFGQRWAPIGESGPPDPYGLAITMSNEMVARVTDFCVVILDDFQLIGEERAIVSFFEVLLEHLPDQVRFVAASRNVYGIPIIPLFVHEELTTIGVKELRFRADELQALVWQTQRVHLPADQAARLAQSADGWIIALLLAVKAMAGGAAPMLSGQTDELYEFLAEEVLHRQPDYLQQFMLATSILEVFTADLCRQVIGSETAVGTLQELLERNLFVVETETSEGPAYQYHQLFADFLQNRLLKQTPDQARLWHARAAEWFNRRGDWERTVRHWLAAGRRTEAAALMDQTAGDLYTRGRTALLENWTAMLGGTPEQLSLAPRLQLYQAKALINSGHMDQVSEQLLGLAEAGLRAQGDHDQVANALLTRSMWLRDHGAFAEALRLAEEAEADVGSRPDLPYRRLQSQRLQGLALLGLGEVERAIGLLQQGADGFRALDKRHDLVSSLNDLTIAYHEQGDIFATQSCAMEAVQLLREIKGGAGLANSLNSAGFVLYETGWYREAWQLFQESLGIAQSNRLEGVRAHLMNSRGDLLRDVEEWSLAEAAYASARSIGESALYTDALSATYSGLMSLERMRGNFNEAMHWLREATRLRKESIESATYQLGVGAIYLEMGQVSLALRALEQALSAWESAPRPRSDQARAEFLLARALSANGSWPEALDMLAKALQHTALLGYDQFLVVEGRRAPALLARAAEAWPAQLQLRSLIERVGQFRVGISGLEEALAAIEPRQTIPRLAVEAFGVGVIRRDGEPIPPAAWLSSRSRALFTYIVDRGQAAKEDIALAFWPDFSPEKFRSNFHATLWRVRRAIGQEALVFEDDRYALRPHILAWYDVAEFEALAQRGIDRGLNSDEQAEAWRSALALYCGPFMEGIDLPWVEARRRQLENLYATGLNHLARWEFNKRRFETAKGWYTTAADLDPYSEEICQAFLVCCLELGHLTEGRAFYLAFRRRLKDDLKTDPSAGLRKLFDRLNAAQS